VDDRYIMCWWTYSGAMKSGKMILKQSAGWSVELRGGGLMYENRKMRPAETIQEQQRKDKG
jgi:hypothetical protein